MVLLLMAVALDSIAEIQARPALIPGLGLEPVAERLLQKEQFVGDELEQSKIAVGIARFEVQSQLYATASGMQPQLEMDTRIFGEELDQRTLLARLQVVQLIGQTSANAVEHAAQEVGHRETAWSPPPRGVRRDRTSAWCCHQQLS